MNRIAAAQAATTALNDINADQSRPIDPFEAIESLGLALQFQPLQDLLGVVLPGQPAGVMINSARPASLQRYTAAHEIGHWYLDQDVLAVDTETTVTGHPHDARELNAQTFAAHFLMPLSLVHLTARRYGLRRGAEADPAVVYQMARDMHVSYQAAAYQLVNCHFITTSNRHALLKVRPATIKRSLAAGFALSDRRGDVWTVEDARGAVDLEVFSGDNIVVKLTETPSTGYRWMQEHGEAGSVHELRPAPPPFPRHDPFAVDRTAVADVIALPEPETSTDVLVPLGDEPAPQRSSSGSVRVGNRVTRVVRYAANAPGHDQIELRHVRPLSSQPPIDAIDLHAVVRGAPAVEFRHRLLTAFAREEAEHHERRG